MRKKNLIITLLSVALFASVIFNVAPVLASDLSEFSSPQQSQLAVWMAASIDSIYGNASSDAVNDGIVLRDGSGVINVKAITITNGENAHIDITPTTITCYDENRDVIACSSL